jgi:hypothetical protein
VFEKGGVEAGIGGLEPIDEPAIDEPGIDDPIPPIVPIPVPEEEGKGETEDGIPPIFPVSLSDPIEPNEGLPGMTGRG